MCKFRPLFYVLVGVGFTLAAVGCSSDDEVGDPLRPIVFVHGSQGSAQQFETQAMRFTSNEYPQDLLFAFGA